MPGVADSTASRDAAGVRATEGGQPPEGPSQSIHPMRPLPRAFAFAAVVAVVGGMTLGLLPPAIGDDVPPTVVRTVAIDARRLTGGGVALGPHGRLVARDRAWTRPASICAPIRFTMVGFVWEQAGDAVIPARLAWGGDGHSGHARVLADPDEGPDPGSADDTGLTGTPPVWTGEARCAGLALRLPRAGGIGGVRAVFINTSGTATEPSFLERAGSLLAAAWGMRSAPLTAEPASAMTAQPSIITRTAWGANEKMRRCGPDYAESVEMAYVHHTVNSNSYSKARADDLIRGIYAYHTRGRGYCDIAYNFLIDRFGRIYEGRYGGMDQPVVGAHAMGFNTGSTGVAALGDFTSRKPPKRVIKAYRKLLSWRLDVAHVRPTGRARMESAGGSTTKYDKGEVVSLPAISGHRETGYTSCPGGRLFARLRAIRTGAEIRGLPKIWDHAATPNPAPPGTMSIRLTATISRAMNWTVDIYNDLAPATPYRSYTGHGSMIDVAWDRKPGTVDPLDPDATAPPGTYTVVFRATGGGEAAREAPLSLALQ